MPDMNKDEFFKQLNFLYEQTLGYTIKDKDKFFKDKSVLQEIKAAGGYAKYLDAQVEAMNEISNDEVLKSAFKSFKVASNDGVVTSVEMDNIFEQIANGYFKKYPQNQAVGGLGFNGLLDEKVVNGENGTSLTSYSDASLSFTPGKINGRDYEGVQISLAGDDILRHMTEVAQAEIGEVDNYPTPQTSYSGKVNVKGIKLSPKK